MKKFIYAAAAIAASTALAIPANAADYGRNDHRGGIHKVQKARVAQRYGNRNVVQVRNSYSQPVRFQATRGHQWSRGQRFDSRYASNYRVVDNYRAYHLQAPPRGYRYVRSNDDIVLVAIASGIIGAVFGSIF